MISIKKYLPFFVRYQIRFIRFFKRIITSSTLSRMNNEKSYTNAFFFRVGRRYAYNIKTTQIKTSLQLIFSFIQRKCYFLTLTVFEYQDSCKNFFQDDVLFIKIQKPRKKPQNSIWSTFFFNFSLLYLVMRYLHSALVRLPERRKRRKEIYSKSSSKKI